MSAASYFHKGIILAGGAGTRLYPLTQATSKQLLPVYDKPMIYYPLSTLLLAGIRQILLISTPQDIHGFERLLGDGGRLGISIQYAVQPRPEGLPQAFVIGREFVGADNVVLVLGDNIFYGQGFQPLLARATSQASGATIFGYPVKDPQRYGVVQFDKDGNVVSLEEKPRQPKSRWAIPGLYFFDHQVLDVAARLQPSARGELEIIDIHQHYLRRGQLRLERFTRGFAWLDTGTHEALAQASSFVQTIEERQGLKIACIEEVAYRKGYIDAEQLRALAEHYPNAYGQYLLSVVDPDVVM
jgi:glucose-1-phosphate thymidylyltransferase